MRKIILMCAVFSFSSLVFADSARIAAIKRSATDTSMFSITTASTSGGTTTTTVTTAVVATRVEASTLEMR